MKKLYLKKQGGFSLVEMLVSISILLLVVTGPMTVTSRTAKSATFATEQVQAFFLAQEGLEIAQKLRDDLLLINFASPGVAWTAFTNTGAGGAYQLCFNPVGNPPGCPLEWAAGGNTVASPVVSCSTITDCRLYLKNTPDRSLYTHSITASTTSFTRQIKFSKTSDDKGVKVVSSVTWRTGSLVAEQRVEVETYLYNIYGL